jgi:hypothetical protein
MHLMFDLLLIMESTIDATAPVELVLPGGAPCGVTSAGMQEDESSIRV